MDGPTRSSDTRETLERTRRIETRLTKMLEHFGINPGAEKPRLEDGVIRLPSRKCRLDAVLEAMPSGYTHEGVDLFVGDDYVATVFVDRP